jgi:tetratricopeptide (TPR) repeat protein
MLLICAAYLAVASLGHLGLLWRRREPQLVLGVGLVVVPFIPATNLFFLVGTTVGERLLYPCTVGSALVLVVLLRRRRWGMPVLAALLLVYTVNSNLRMGVWSSKGKLFSTDAVHWGKSAKVLHQHAVEQQARGDLNTALINYVKSLTIFDDQAITDYCIARILLHLDRVPEALAYFDKILNGHGIGFHDGNDFLWMTDLGYALIAHNQDKEQLDQGIYYMKEGLNRFPHNCYGWNALGVAQIRLMKLQEALQSISIGLECDSSSASLWNNAAVAYAYGDMWNDARSALQNALDRNASRPAVQRNARVFTGEAPAGTPPELDLFLPMQNR